MKAFFLILGLLFTPILAKTQIDRYLHEVEIDQPDSGLDGVDCLYVINLEKRPQKWIRTLQAFEAFNLHPNRVEAIDGWLLSKEDLQILSGDYPVRLRGGQVGCLLSHLCALKDAYEKKHTCIWVCEDDVVIRKNPHELSPLLQELSAIDPQWDVLYTDLNSKNRLGQELPSLGSDFRPDTAHESLSYYTKRQTINKRFVKIGQRFGAYSMLISQRGIEKIFDYFTNLYLWTAYDIDIHYVPTIRQYALSTTLASFDHEKSSDTCKQLP